MTYFPVTRYASTFFVSLLGLALLYAVGGGSLAAHAQAQDSISVMIPEVDAEPGETVTIEVEADLGSSEVESYTRMEFTFDGSIVTVVDVRDGSSLSFGAQNLVTNLCEDSPSTAGQSTGQCANEVDSLRVSNIADNPPVTGSGVFLEIDVELNEDTGAPFELSPSSTEDVVPTSIFGKQGGGNLEVTSVTQGFVGELARAVPVEDGWTLASIPLKTDDQTFGGLLPSCQSGFFFAPGLGYDHIDEGESVEPGPGFFANCSAATVEMSGVPPSTSSVAVDQGWNLIGALTDPVAVSDVGSDPGGIVQTDFFAFDEGYQAADTLHPGHGYWVEVSQQGTLDLSGEAPSSPALATAATDNPSAQGARLTVTDAEGRSTRLHLARDLPASRQQQFARPPKPPSGLYDVRFATGHTAAALSGADAEGGALPPIELQGLAFPVEVRLDGRLPEDQVLRLGPEGEDVQLTPERRSVSLHETTKRLPLRVQGAPDEFALEQSRPHPATHRATIEYAVPSRVEVSIEVFDALGRRVAELARGTKRAGVHQVQVDAAQMPSGTYFVRMRADGVEKTQRLTVVR